MLFGSIRAEIRWAAAPPNLSGSISDVLNNEDVSSSISLCCSQCANRLLVIPLDRSG